MGDDKLERLLQQADATAGELEQLPTDLAARVRRRAARSRRLRVGVGAAAAIVLATGFTAIWSRTGAPLNAGPEPEPQYAGARQPERQTADLLAEVSRLRNEARVRLAVARETESIMRRMRRASEIIRCDPMPDPVAEVRHQLDQTAFTLVQHADRMCRAMDLCSSAAAKYRRVIELFPDSPWATVARQRLAKLEIEGDIS